MICAISQESERHRDISYLSRIYVNNHALTENEPLVRSLARGGPRRVQSSRIHIVVLHGAREPALFRCDWNNVFSAEDVEVVAEGSVKITIASGKHRTYPSRNP